MLGHALTETPQGLRLTLSGDLDSLAAQSLDAAMEASLAPATADLIVDLEALNYLNSTGIRSFIRMHKLLRASGHRIYFRGASPKVLRVFHHCGLDTFFHFEPGPEVPSGCPLVAGES